MIRASEVTKQFFFIKDLDGENEKTNYRLGEDIPTPATQPGKDSMAKPNSIKKWKDKP